MPCNTAQPLGSCPCPSPFPHLFQYLCIIGSLPLLTLPLAEHLPMYDAISADQLHHTPLPKAGVLSSTKLQHLNRHTDPTSHPDAALRLPHSHLFFFAGPFAISSGEAPSSAMAARLPFGGFLPCK